MVESGQSQMKAGGAPSGAARAVFISYASQDVGGAETIATALERARITCWLAPRDVVPGAHYADEIVRAINDAKLVVLILSRHSIGSPHVGKEIERAASKSKRIVALRVDSVALTRAFEYFLSESQWIEVGSGGIESAAIKLVEAVQRYVDPNGAGETPSVKGLQVFSATPVSSRRWLIIASVVIASLALLYVAADKRWQRKDVATIQAVPVATPAGVPTLATPDKSVAVLPFADMSEKKDQEYFSDGLSEELIDMLTKVDDLHVPARTSSFYYKGKQVTIAEIAKALGVTHVLEGSVRKAGNTLRVTAQLIRVDNGYHVWSQTYDRQLNDVFEVQDEIASAVVSALKVSLRAGQTPHIDAPKNVEVYNLMLHARYYHYRGNTHDAQRAVDYYKQITQLDPTYAPGWAGLSRAITELPSYNLLTRSQSREPALHAAERALALDPQLAEAHVALGKILYHNDWDWRAAEMEFRRAQALDPRDAFALMFLGDVAVTLGRMRDALDLYEQALERDPLSDIMISRKAQMNVFLGRLPEAEVASRYLIELNPAGDVNHFLLALILVDSGRLHAALGEVAGVSSPESHEFILARAFRLPGHKGEADAALIHIEKKFSTDSAYDIAALHALRGEIDKGFMWLDRAYAQHEYGLENVVVDPDLKNLRPDPRFKTLLRKMNLAPLGTS